jgi:Peptidase inhibitor family I36
MTLRRRIIIALGALTLCVAPLRATAHAESSATVPGTTAYTASAAESPLEGPMPRSAATTCDNSTGTGYCITTAPPSEGYIPCPTGYMCLYSLAGWKGMQVRFPAGNWHPNLGYIKCPVSDFCKDDDDGFNDEVSSWANNGTGILYCVNWDIVGEGEGWRNNDMPSGAQGSYIGDLWNDQASALSNSGC